VVIVTLDLCRLGVPLAPISANYRLTQRCLVSFIWQLSGNVQTELAVR
jgi:hypothetical protein